MDTSLSGQRCVGVLFPFPVTWRRHASAGLQQLQPFRGPHPSQPHPWNQLHHHAGSESLTLWRPVFIFIHTVMNLCVCVCVYVRPAQEVDARWAHPARLKPRRAPRRVFRHRWSPLCPHMYSTSAGHHLTLRMVRDMNLICCTETESESRIDISRMDLSKYTERIYWNCWLNWIVVTGCGWLMEQEGESWWFGRTTVRCRATQLVLVFQLKRVTVLTGFKVN